MTQEQSQVIGSPPMCVPYSRKAQGTMLETIQTSFAYFSTVQDNGKYIKGAMTKFVDENI